MNKIKFTCGKPTQAECVETQVEVNSQSSLTEEDCLSQEELNTDVYTQLEKLWNESDLEALGELCLSYTLVGGKKIVKNVLLKFEEKICELEERIDLLEERQLCDFPLEGCNFSYGDLVDECGEQPQTWKDLIQILINNNQTPP